MISFTKKRPRKGNVRKVGKTTLEVPCRSACRSFLFSALFNDAVNCSNYTASMINE
jgi:hypothetical protein